MFFFIGKGYFESMVFRLWIQNILVDKHKFKLEVISNTNLNYFFKKDL